MKNIAIAFYVLLAFQPAAAQVQDDPTVSAEEVARMMSGRAISDDEDWTTESRRNPRHVFTPNARWYPRYSDNELQWRRDDAQAKMLELAVIARGTF